MCELYTVHYTYTSYMHERNLQFEMRDKKTVFFFSFYLFFVETNMDMKEIENKLHAHRRDIIITILCAHGQAEQLKLKCTLTSK